MNIETRDNLLGIPLRWTTIAVGPKRLSITNWSSRNIPSTVDMFVPLQTNVRTRPLKQKHGHTHPDLLDLFKPLFDYTLDLPYSAHGSNLGELRPTHSMQLLFTEQTLVALDISFIHSHRPFGEFALQTPLCSV